MNPNLGQLWPFIFSVIIHYIPRQSLNFTMVHLLILKVILYPPLSRYSQCVLVSCLLLLSFIGYTYIIVNYNYYWLTNRHSPLWSGLSPGSVMEYYMLIYHDGTAPHPQPLRAFSVDRCGQMLLHKSFTRWHLVLEFI